MSLLAVDDNEAHCYAMCRVLRHAGYDVLQAHTGSDALKIAYREHIDLALLDINLPDLTGYELLQALREHPRTQKLPVVIHTATEPTQYARHKAEILGAAAFLTYPIEPRDLLNVVKGILAKDGEDRLESKRGIETPANFDPATLTPELQRPFRHLLGISREKISEADMQELHRLLQSTEVLLGAPKVASPYRQTIEELRSELQRYIAERSKGNGNSGRA
jgi:CheY-like chemotaxis protein